MKILLLARMLLRQRLRKQQRQYGAYVAITSAAVLLVVVWKAASVMGHLAGTPRLPLHAAMQSLWFAWLATGVVTGWDMTWHTRIEKLTVLRLPLILLYAADLLLAFVSYPMLFLFGAISFLALRSGWTMAHASAAFAGLVAFVWLTRAAISIVRTALYRSLPFGARRWFRAGVPAVIAAAAIVVIPFPSIARFLPVDSVGAAVMRGSAIAVAALVVTFLALATVDYSLQRRVIRSGLTESTRLGISRGWTNQFFLSASLWRVALLGWLRNPNAVLLFLWGVSYGFLFEYFRPPKTTSDVLLFAWMLLIFHAYVRGNLLGVDHRAVWFYYQLPGGLSRGVAAKNRSLSLLQGVMVGAALLPSLWRPAAGMTSPLAWACVLSFGVSGILLGEISGGIFSLLHPEPIERGSMYSGAMTLGAFVIPGFQSILVACYFVVLYAPSGDFPVAISWVFYVVVPLALSVVCWRALPAALSTLALRHKEPILEKLGAVTP